MNSVSRIILIPMVFSFLMVCPAPGYPAPVKIAVMPMGNFSAYPEATDQILPRLLSSLEKSGYELVPYEELYSFLLRNRIREKGTVSRSTARRIGKKFGADAILVGSVTTYYFNDKYPLLGLSLRMINPGDGTIFWAHDVSYSGEDSRSFFNLGAITKMEDSIAMVMKKLMREYPLEIPRPSKQPPIELESILIDEKVRGGKKVEIYARYSIIKEGAYQLVLIIGDGIGIPMTEIRTGFYQASTDAPADEGSYPLKIKWTDDNKRVWTINPGISLEVDNTPPIVKITMFKTMISPNDDGIEDSTTILLDNQSTDRIKRWNLKAQTSEGAVHLISQFYGPFPSMIDWFGQDERNMVLPDGRFSLKLEAEDEAGNVGVSESASIIIDTTPPRLRVTGSLEDAGQWKKVKLRIFATDKNSIKRYQLKILGKDEETLKLYEGLDQPPEEVVWEKVPPEITALAYELTVEDIAGNTSEITDDVSTKKKRKRRRKIKFR